MSSSISFDCIKNMFTENKQEDITKQTKYFSRQYPPDTKQAKYQGCCSGKQILVVFAGAVAYILVTVAFYTDASDHVVEVTLVSKFWDLAFDTDSRDNC